MACRRGGCHDERLKLGESRELLAHVAALLPASVWDDEEVELTNVELIEGDGVIVGEQAQRALRSDLRGELDGPPQPVVQCPAVAKGSRQ